MSTDITTDIQAMITDATDAWNRHDADAYVKDMDDGSVSVCSPWMIDSAWMRWFAPR